jgi:hypothetical protein
MMADFSNFKNLQTVLYGLLLAILPAATQYLGAVNWDSVFSFLGQGYSTTVAMVVSSLVAGFIGWLTPPPVKK